MDAENRVAAAAVNANDKVFVARNVALALRENFLNGFEQRFVGFAAGLVNFIDEFPYLEAELLPRLKRLGLRA